MRTTGLVEVMINHMRAAVQIQHTHPRYRRFQIVKSSTIHLHTNQEQKLFRSLIPISDTNHFLRSTVLPASLRYLRHLRGLAMAALGQKMVTQLMSALRGGLNGWTQHFIFEGKDGVEL
jgi:hypothetical protein